MALWVEQKYAKLISPRLNRYTDKGNGATFVANFRCPICGDSKKKLSTRRGYFHVKAGKMFMHCHNCSSAMTFESFLHDFDINVYKEFKFENFKEDNYKSDQQKLTDDDVKDLLMTTKKYIPNIFNGLSLVSELDKTHEVRAYCENRKLPIESFDFYFAENFIEWTKDNTDKFKNWKDVDHSRLVLPWRDRDQRIIGYSARAFDADIAPKYYRIFLDDQIKEPFFGMDRLDDTKRHYVFEGEIDSLMIPNSIAVANGKLQVYRHQGAVYVPDADRRNPHICKNISGMIDAGLKVCLLPEELPGKDMNELVQKNFTSTELVDIINRHTYVGVQAVLMFNKWKRV